MKTLALGPFLGINNRLPDFALRIRTRQLSGDFLRSAINVDVDNSGNLRSRRATERTTVVAGAHSRLPATTFRAARSTPSLACS